VNNNNNNNHETRRDEEKEEEHQVAVVVIVGLIVGGRRTADSGRIHPSAAVDTTPRGDIKGDDDRQSISYK